MPYNEINRIWDSRRGWVKPHRGILIRRKKPIDDVTLKELEEMSNAPISKEWGENGTGYYLEGYKKGSSPLDRYVAFIMKEKRFNKINRWLNMIPFVTVEVIE